MIGYFAAITAMDVQVGRIVDDLGERGLLESTVIMFLGDNGFNCGHHGIWGKGNGTYPLNMYEESVKVPAVISMPGTINTGVCHELISGYDLAPTLLELAGIGPAALGTGPGRSFADLITGIGRPRERVVIFDEYGATRMIRTRQWKYVLRRGDEPDELYDLDTDPGERSNLVLDPNHAGRVLELRAQLEGWFDEYADPTYDSSNLEVTGFGQTEVLGRPGPEQ